MLDYVQAERDGGLLLLLVCLVLGVLPYQVDLWAAYVEGENVRLLLPHVPIL